MNIFVLSRDPEEAARFQCDKHVVKMILESAQMLSTINGGPYKPTHANHPCTLWAARSTGNYTWLVQHALALCAEYSYRYNKTHKCEAVIKALCVPPAHVNLLPLTEHVQCMPDPLRGPCPVQAYRRYYATKTFAEWNRNRPPPDWF